MAGTLYIIAAPSGAGKTSLVNALIKQVENICLSISYTTRSKRPREQEGIAYYFVDESTFEEMMTNQLFLESATVFGHHYGTSELWVTEKLQQGHDVILEIDWQGAQQVRQKITNAVSIFIAPPSRESLVQRLHHRKQDDAEVIAQRMEQLKNEMLHYREFDYLIINENFNHALADLQAIVRTERLRCARQQVQYQALLAALLA